ncbi:D-alanyl-D-alanine carboxypeptidase/D-alanyl-D-alanine-endopeptidase [Virgibacillus byunsanensis]|uniref:D-alanyl-D-alanine carboxypeptidase/D-alanyl-D-alanine-endopeptidase n=1 Tax=Virgibacillus byunsanensis TaxID=570945 RepID=A0ABW3LSP0_9BACI
MVSKENVQRVFFISLIAMVAFLPFHERGVALFVAASEESTQDESTEHITLEQKMDEILTDERLEGTSTGINIKHAETGEDVYSHFGDIRLHPASNMKLLTSIATLETLGPDYKFTTEVLTDGNVKGDVLQGNVYVKGKGDPTLLKEDFNHFAEDLKGQGIKKIKGDLIGDDSWYDDVRLSLDLNWSDEPYYTGAQVSALTLSPNEDYDAGTVIVEVKPASKVGESPQVTMTPKTDYVTIVNKAETVAEDKSKSISIEREHGTNNIVVEGQIPLDGTRARSWAAVWEPTGYALDVFKKSLEEKGITFVGKTEMKTDGTPKNATVLTSKKSMTLEELFIPFMKLSNNGHGETLIKEMGRVVHGEGSWDKGIEVVENVVSELGVDTETLLLRDGSGMSHKNMIPAEEISQLLYAAQDKNWFPVFENALPVAGEPERFVGGTLRYRMTGDMTRGNVKAKTGSLTGMSTLSGYVTAKDGEELIFSIMINNYVGSSVTSIEDAIATVLAEHETE